MLPGVIGCIQVRMKEGHGKRGLIYTVKCAAAIFKLKIAAAHFSYHLILCPAIWRVNGIASLVYHLFYFLFVPCSEYYILV